MNSNSYYNDGFNNPFTPGMIMNSQDDLPSSSDQVKSKPSSNESSSRKKSKGAIDKKRKTKKINKDYQLPNHLSLKGTPDIISDQPNLQIPQLCEGADYPKTSSQQFACKLSSLKGEEDNNSSYDYTCTGNEKSCLIRHQNISGQDYAVCSSPNIKNPWRITSTPTFDHHLLSLTNHQSYDCDKSSEEECNDDIFDEMYYGASGTNTLSQVDDAFSKLNLTDNSYDERHQNSTGSFDLLHQVGNQKLFDTKTHLAMCLRIEKQMSFLKRRLETIYQLKKYNGDGSINILLLDYETKFSGYLNEFESICTDLAHIFAPLVISEDSYSNITDPKELVTKNYYKKLTKKAKKEFKRVMSTIYSEENMTFTERLLHLAEMPNNDFIQFDNSFSKGIN